jgi:hypothetical protein
MQLEWRKETILLVIFGSCDEEGPPTNPGVRSIRSRTQLAVMRGLMLADSCS